MPSMARRFRDILGFVTDIAIRFKMALTTSYLHTKCRTAHYCAQPWQKRLAIDLDVFAPKCLHAQHIIYTIRLYRRLETKV